MEGSMQTVPMVRVVNQQLYMPMMVPGGGQGQGQQQQQVQQSPAAQFVQTPYQVQGNVQQVGGAQFAQGNVQHQQHVQLVAPQQVAQGRHLTQQVQGQPMAQQQVQQHQMPVPTRHEEDVEVFARYEMERQRGVRSISPPPNSDGLKPAVSRVNTAPIGGRIDDDLKVSKGNDELFLLPGVPTSDKPACHHNKWMLMTKKKRFYIMKCTICGALWKTKLKSTQKCADFFAGHCALDEQCPHPHIYSRSKLRRMAEEATENIAEGVLVNIDAAEGDGEDEPSLFIPMSLEDCPTSKEKRANIPYTQGHGPDTLQVISSQSSEKGPIRPVRRETGGGGPAVVLLNELESSKRLNIGLMWFVGLQRMADLKSDLPDWLVEQTVKHESVVVDTSHSIRSSRLLKWKLSTNHSGATAFTEISGRTEPPELEDGDELPYLLDSACLTVDPEPVFTVLPHQVGYGSFGPLYAVKIKDCKRLCQVVPDKSVAEWLTRDRPILTAQIIDLQKIGIANENEIMKELECLHEIQGSPHLPKLIRSFAQRDLWVVTDSGFTARQLDMKTYCLADILSGAGGNFPTEDIHTALLHTAKGLSHMVNTGWIHLNVNTRSLLYDESSQIWKLTSFKKVVPCQLHATYTPPPPSEMTLLIYTPQEHYSPGYCSHKSDIFALGMTGMSMLGIQAHHDPPTEPIRAALFAFCKVMTAMQTADRPTAHELVQKLEKIIPT